MKRLGYLGLFLALAGAVMAQRWGRNSRFEDAHTPREIVQHSTETPNWTNGSGFEQDVVTFVRIRRDRKPYGSGGTWWTDAPVRLRGSFGAEWRTLNRAA